MAVVIKDTILVTVDPDDAIRYDAAIAVQNGSIAALGPSAEILARYPGAEVVDGSTKAVFPGFANIHTHFSMIIAKGIYEDLSPPNKPPFTSGLAPIPLPDLDSDEMRLMCRLAALEAIRSGTTAVLEDGANIDVYADAIAETGLRLLLCERSWDKAKGSIGDQGGFEVDRTLGERTMGRIADLYTKWHGASGDRIRVGVAAPDMCSPDLLKQLRMLQERLDTVS